ncbi:hypothetical protein GE061_018233 [Apolygus lucorum]|uniref:Non-homologous end-joining factor 1 n=1 Tax=Apolygus lucorum TaxID=248454 RepID=A0A6A4JG34_APOLU|nr:hypothetical protein GE061_018233 [Apolygus lucorum]
MKLICREGSEHFYLRKDVEGNRITICVSNLRSLWRSQLTEDDVLGLFRRQNPLLQAKSECIMTYIHSCLDSKESSTTVKIDDRNKSLALRLVSQASEIKVKLHLILEIQDDQEFFREVTNPMVAVVMQLMEQRSKLLSLVRSKDLELREYKLEGAEITRKNVETNEVLEKEFIEESLSEFLDKTRANQFCTELNLSPDLSQIFTEVTRLKPDDSSSSNVPNPPSPVVPDRLNGTKFLPVKMENKRPIGNETIVQVPRSKLRKKNFNL